VSVCICVCSDIYRERRREGEREGERDALSRGAEKKELYQRESRLGVNTGVQV